jgi:peroxiredoxin Q/BCP
MLKWIHRLIFSIIDEGSTSMIEAGSNAPSFAMTNQDGAAVKLEDFAGKYVLLWWYPKADTPG